MTDINGGALYWGSNGGKSPGGVGSGAGNLEGSGSGSLEASAFLFRDDLEGGGQDERDYEDGEGDEYYHDEEDYEEDDKEGVEWEGGYNNGQNEEWDKENNSGMPSFKGIDMGAIGGEVGGGGNGDGEEGEPTPRMDDGFYKSFESLLKKPAPKFNIGEDDKRNDEEIRKNKARLRKLEQQSGKAPSTQNVESKIDTGNRRGGGGRRASKSSAGEGGSINEALLAEAFKYAERCAAVEALDNMPGEAAKAAKASGKGGEGFFAGNPMSMVRGVKQQRKVGGGGGNKGVGSSSKVSKAYNAGMGGGVLMNRSNSAGGVGIKKRGKKKGTGKMKQKGMKYGGGMGGDGKGGKKQDMEQLLMQLSSGGEVARLKAELEASKRSVEASSDFLRSAAGDFLQAKR